MFHTEAGSHYVLPRLAKNLPPSCLCLWSSSENVWDTILSLRYFYIGSQNYEVQDFGKALTSFSKDEKPPKEVEVGRSGVTALPGLHGEVQWHSGLYTETLSPKIYFTFKNKIEI